MLYKDVSDQLREAIISKKYPENSKLPTVQELCAQYDVSAITIRRALDLLRKQGYITRQPRIGTTVISSNPENGFVDPERLPTIAVIMTGFADSFGTPLLEGALEQARNNAHILLSKSSGSDAIEEQEIDSAIQAKVDGLILLPSDSEFIPASILNLISQKFPVTIIDRVFHDVPIATVSSDNLTASRDATSHLFSLGHRNIAFISSGGHASSNISRRRGWELAHASASISLDEELFLGNLKSTLPGSSQAEEEEDVEKLIRFFSEHPQITACIVAEYNIALLSRLALERLHRRIPEDISVICFDHNSYAFDSQLFRFTHVEQQQAELGRLAIQLTLRQIRQGPSTEQILLPTHLVLGQSTREISLEHR
ncbi:MAG: GntR family transcriptional regulator [Bifidobacterium sp.]|uniref:GntR family transcriptional regulator n=1 Tax=Bifidobacterium fermentum TaxID=3059035 RepID=A0AB39UD31_9BIFI